MLGPLTERDRLILTHVCRYRLTTTEATHHWFFQDSNQNAAVKVLSRLVRTGWLVRHVLFETRSYFQMTPAGVRTLGASKRLAEPFREQGLVDALGVLGYCARRQVNRFMSREFAELFPELVRPGLPATHYYVEASGNQPQLAYLHVDHGASLGQVIAKLRRVISLRYTVPRFAKLIQDQGFHLGVATATEARKRTIESRLPVEIQTPISFHVEVLPELCRLLLNITPDRTPRRERGRS